MIQTKSTELPIKLLNQSILFLDANNEKLIIPNVKPNSDLL